jgi:predicted DCC family thiol-disulfide oxidoreductase YuxK
MRDTPVSYYANLNSQVRPTAGLAPVSAGPLVGPLTVLFDPDCPLCRELRNWLSGRRTSIPLELIAAGSDLARLRFPDLDVNRTSSVLTLIDGRGAVFEDEGAWLVLASILGWDGFARHFASRTRKPFVRAGLKAVDSYRMIGKKREARVGAESECIDGCNLVSRP